MIFSHPFTIIQIDSFFALFQDLPNLTHLFGIYPLSHCLLSAPPSVRCFPGPDRDAVLKRLYKFPKLRFIDCYCNQIPGQEHLPKNIFQHTFLELERDDILEEMAYEFLESGSLPRSCFQTLWGMCHDFWETIWYFKPDIVECLEKCYHYIPGLSFVCTVFHFSSR